MDLAYKHNRCKNDGSYGVIVKRFNSAGGKVFGLDTSVGEVERVRLNVSKFFEFNPYVSVSLAGGDK